MFALSILLSSSTIIGQDILKNTISIKMHPLVGIKITLWKSTNWIEEYQPNQIK